MASFQKTGERYDTVGIHPDIRLEPVPSDWYGKTDSVLERVQGSDCSAYDCEFVALAQVLGTHLVTMDGKLLKAFPSIAKPLPVG